MTEGTWHGLVASSSDTLRAYEDAATAIGRLDATARLAGPEVRRLLVLRCAVRPFGASRDGMIALLRPDGEGEAEVRAFLRALETGAARARGGVVPSVAMLHELLGDPADAADAGPDRAEADAFLLDAQDRPPPLLKAMLVAGALLRSAPDEPARPRIARLAALAAPLLLCVGGATTDAWLTIPTAGADEDLAAGPPEGDAGWDRWLLAAFGALAREARAAERGIAAARARAEHDVRRVSEALGRAAYSALDMLAMLRSDLVLTVQDAARALAQTPPTAGAAVARLEELGIAREVTGRARSRIFVYEGLVDALAPPAA